MDIIWTFLVFYGLWPPCQKIMTTKIKLNTQNCSIHHPTLSNIVMKLNWVFKINCLEVENFPDSKRPTCFPGRSWAASSRWSPTRIRISTDTTSPDTPISWQASRYINLIQFKQNEKLLDLSPSHLEIAISYIVCFKKN